MAVPVVRGVKQMALTLAALKEWAVALMPAQKCRLKAVQAAQREMSAAAKVPAGGARSARRHAQVSRRHYPVRGRRPWARNQACADAAFWVADRSWLRIS